MLYTINELNRKLYPKIYETYDIFVHHFGEEYTDLHLKGNVIIDNVVKPNDEGKYEISDETLNTLPTSLCKAYIYVWWPNVRVTNEHDKYIDIKDLYAKICINNEGCIPHEYYGFKLARATFTRKQFISGYIHSHISTYAINSYSRKPEFSDPCLGTGPIRNTITSLKLEYSSVEWMLFCQELALYVTVESLTGGPYIKLETVGSIEKFKVNNNYSTPVRNSLKSYGEAAVSIPQWPEILEEFILYYIEHINIAIQYINGSFAVGSSYYDYMVDISNAFITWFNSSKFTTQAILNALYDNVILSRFIVKNGEFYKESSRESSIERSSGRKLLTFKGKDITISINETDDDRNYYTILLNHNIAMGILNRFMNILNYHFKNGNTNKSRESQEGATSINQTVCYI